MKCLSDIESANFSTGDRRRRVVGDGESRAQISRGFIDVTRLGPGDEVKFGPREGETTVTEIVRHAEAILRKRKFIMHYRNGREAKNGDTIIQIGHQTADGIPTIEKIGVLHDAVAGNDYCNGKIAPVHTVAGGACMCDCLHVDDVMAMLKEKGLDKRPSGKYPS